jgi:hypothetical protein
MASISTKSLSLLYRGIVQLDGQSVCDVQVQHVLPPGLTSRVQFFTVDFFIDPATFQVLMMQDTLSEGLVRQVRYSNFNTISGVVVPLSINTRFNGQSVWDINLTGINFNRGLTASDFSF